MDRMLYVAMSGAKETMLAMSNNSNNLANANTPGFLEDLNQFRSMPVFGNGYPTRVYAMDERPQTNFAKGQMQQTGNPLDIAVRGPGFFAVQAEDGTEGYTRRGDLQIDVNGILRNGAGQPILGDGGPIALPEFEEVMIGNDGTITIKPVGATTETLAVIDRIRIVEPPIGDLVKGEDGLMRLRDGTPAEAVANGEVLSGFVESSNINVVDALVNMIDYSRRYEMQIKMMKEAKAIDEKGSAILREG
jgi:flagellar basal-body rod protein FlgF